MTPDRHAADVREQHPHPGDDPPQVGDKVMYAASDATGGVWKKRTSRPSLD